VLVETLLSGLRSLLKSITLPWSVIVPALSVLVETLPNGLRSLLIPIERLLEMKIIRRQKEQKEAHFLPQVVGISNLDKQDRFDNRQNAGVNIQSEQRPFSPLPFLGPSLYQLCQYWSKRYQMVFVHFSYPLPFLGPLQY
jgi:hypothetical protein